MSHYVLNIYFRTAIYLTYLRAGAFEADSLSSVAFWLCNLRHPWFNLSGSPTVNCLLAGNFPSYALVLAGGQILPGRNEQLIFCFERKSFDEDMMARNRN